MRRPTAEDERYEQDLDDLVHEAYDVGATGRDLEAFLADTDLDVTATVRSAAVAEYERGAREACPLPFCRRSGLPITRSDSNGTQFYRCGAGHEFHVTRSGLG